MDSLATKFNIKKKSERLKHQKEHKHQKISAMNRINDLISPNKARIYRFNEGTLNDSSLLGIKGANICEMIRLKLPVPPGFIISSDTCVEYYHKPEMKRKLNDQMITQCRKAIYRLEQQSGGQFHLETTPASGDQNAKLPLLLAVRSSPSIDMPEFMDSVLNVGINDKVVEVMATVSENPRWAYDTYRRFIQMYGTVVLNVDGKKYEDILTRARQSKGVEHDSLLDAADLKQIVAEFKAVKLFPQDPWQQLTTAIESVFYSWFSPRAVKYREANGITNDLGSAVIVQAMVYGNLNNHSGSGVVVTRNPTTGQQEIFGEYLANSTFTDITRGLRKPQTLQDMREEHQLVYDAIFHIAGLLEDRFRNVQHFGFTIQNGALYVLHTRTAKCTARAAVHIAVSMVVEKRITERDALLRLDPQQMSYFLQPVVDPKFAARSDDPKVKKMIFGRGQPGSPGTALGKLVFSDKDAASCRAKKEECVLVTLDATIDDFTGLTDASGLIAIFGGLTSDVSMLMRSMNKPVVIGASSLRLNREKQELTSADGSMVLRAGDKITVDGSSGLIYKGAVPFVVSGQDDYFSTVLAWADKYKKVQVQATVASRHDLKKAKELGAEGVGLYKTEHLFYQREALELFQQVILSQACEERGKPLAQLQHMHQTEFAELFRELEGRSVKIRLLNKGFDVFLPNPLSMKPDAYRKEVEGIAQRLGQSFEACHGRILSLSDANAAHGIRGSRMAVIFPDVFEMQIRAIAGAILDAKKQDLPVNASVVIPQKFAKIESDMLVPLTKRIALEVTQDARFSLRYLNMRIGAMIEVPNGCMNAEQLVSPQGVDFVGFDSNDLTELMFGISQADRKKLIPSYMTCQNIFAKDPFVELDIPSVGNMLRSAIGACKYHNAASEVTVYGNHCSDRNSLRFLTQIGVDSVCCDPYLVPIAKIAAAQGALLDGAAPKSKGGGEFWRRMGKQ